MPPKIRVVKEVTRVGTNNSIAVNGGSVDALLVSQGHYRLPSGMWSGGGDFWCLHRSYKHPGAREELKRFWLNSNTAYVSAQVVAGTPTYVVPVLTKSSAVQDLVDTAGYAPQGYNLTKPGHSEFDAIVALKELITDGIPSIPFLAVLKGPLRDLPARLRAAIANFRLLGDEYLNAVFGWKPFVHDLRRLYNLMKTIDIRVAKLIRQNGHTIRRRVVLRDLRDVQTVKEVHNLPYKNVIGGTGWVAPYWSGPNQTYTKVTYTLDKIWYSARYRYWIPDITSWGWNARARLVLFGAVPTPGVLWAAMPWSWLADWFGSIGNLLSTLDPSAVPNLVQLYGYTMRHTAQVVECISQTNYPRLNTRKPNFALGQEWEGTDTTFVSRYTDSTKRRTGGFNPFGPDAGVGALSAYQSSILAALGLSKGSRF